MNRQTMAVAIGTLAVLVIAVIALYFSPSPDANPPAATPKVATKATKAKANGDARVPPRRLIHKREIPEDRVAAPDGAPNVVVLFASTQRKDQWSIYGGPAEVTPVLAAKAAEGVAMMDAIAAAVSPHETAAALTTGTYPHLVGAVEPGEKRNGRPLAQSAVTLAEHFAEAGWYTVGASANHHYNKRMAQNQGFDWYRDSQPFSFMQDRRIPAANVVKFALRQVTDRNEAQRGRPLYLQLALADSHKPFKLPKAEYAVFEGEGHKIAPYRATVHRLDSAVDKLLLGLAEEGITEANTLFVVVGDHGEGLDMPPHHRKQHGYVLYPSSVEIPWVMWGQGVPKGRQVTDLVSQIDVAPTVLGLAGLKPADGIEGLDLSGLVKGTVKKSPRAFAYADTLFRGVHRASVWTKDRQCQQDFGTSIEIPDDGFEAACYDRKADPTFLKAISDDALMKQLVAEHDRLMASVETAPQVNAASVEE